MTLRELMAQYPEHFYPQAWYLHEAFMDVEAGSAPTVMPAYTVFTLQPPRSALCSAAHLAALYITHPEHVLWQKYLWTSDVDNIGQRVYVGSNGHGLEIHRHIHLTTRFATPHW